MTRPPPADRASAIAHSVEGAGWRVLHDGLDAAIARWGNRVVGAYAIGSLAHGGFAPGASDIDLALIFDRLDPDLGAAMDEIRAQVHARLGTPLSARLSLFWSTWGELARPHPQGRFPLVDRIDLARASVCLRGDDRRAEVRFPDGEALGRGLVIEGADFMLGKLATESRNQLIRDPDALIVLGTREVTKAVLFPVRFLYTLGTGQCDGNAPAVRWYSAQPRSVATTLAKAALAWRDVDLDPAKARELLYRELPALHRELTNAYAEALDGYGEAERAHGMRAWRDRLEAAAAS